ncbi:MAG: pitrilysin family protein [Gammaproteobacteria bacterium]
MHTNKGFTMLKHLSLFFFVFVSSVQASPQIQQWETKNGARVLFVEAHDLPMLDINVVFDAGSARDDGAEGLASLTNALLTQGAAGLSADQIAIAMEDRGAELSSSVGDDMATLSLRSLKDDVLLQPALELFAKVIAKPDFPKGDFEREQQRMITSARYRKQKPGSIASEQFSRLIYADHPYASVSGGTEETLATITTKQVQNFYAAHYTASNALIAIVGDLTKAQALVISENLVAGLSRGSALSALPKVSDLLAAKQVVLKHPATQTHILMGEPGNYRGDPDYFSLYVGNFILGGSGLVSRISEEVREKRGLSYSAYSYFSPLKRKGIFTLGLQTKNENRDEALSVLKQTLNDFVDKGPTEKELLLAKKNITGGFPIRISSNGKIIGYLAVIGFYNLPLDYLDAFNQKIESVTVDQIKDAFKRRVHPDKMITVIVGG